VDSYECKFCEINGLKLHQFTFWKYIHGEKSADTVALFQCRLQDLVQLQRRGQRYIWSPMPVNNVAQNANRLFVLGPKNFLFACHPKGAMACANFLSQEQTKLWS
jgi:hypothetical protein